MLTLHSQEPSRVSKSKIDQEVDFGIESVSDDHFVEELDWLEIGFNILIGLVMIGNIALIFYPEPGANPGIQLAPPVHLEPAPDVVRDVSDVAVRRRIPREYITPRTRSAMERIIQERVDLQSSEEVVRHAARLQLLGIPTIQDRLETESLGF